MSDKRFVVIFKQNDGLKGSTRILQDTVTGACYLQVAAGYGLAMTPLLGPDGQPVVQTPPRPAEETAIR